MGTTVEEVKHDPTLRNKIGMTTAMGLAVFGKRIPKRWEHDPAMRDIHGNTVAMWLTCNNKEIPT